MIKNQWLKGSACFLLLSTLTNAVAADNPSPIAFKVFSGLSGKNLPEAALSKIPVAPIAYEQFFYESGQDRTKLPGETGVTRYLNSLKLHDRDVNWLVLDMETWGGKPGGRKAVDQYVDFAALVKQQYPTIDIGYYGLLPQRDYWAAIQAAASQKAGKSDSDDSVITSWQSLNDSRTDIMNEIDILFPSLYTFYNSPEEWQQYAIEMMQEARRIANGRPVIPFIWPLYHGSNKDIGGEKIDAAFWRLQLETVKEYADSVIVWGWFPEQEDFTESDAWWVVTQEFVEGIGG